MSASTSFRLSSTAKSALSARAAHEGVSATALLEQLIVEGVRSLDHPGIVYRGPTHDRRAALAAGPDVWEVVHRLRDLKGSEEQRITTLSKESELHPRLIRVAVDFAARHPDEIRERIRRPLELVETHQHDAEQREALLA